MDSEFLKILSEELRETRELVIQARRQADAAMLEAQASMKRADSSWSLS